jgi:hypothetical protein
MKCNGGFVERTEIPSPASSTTGSRTYPFIVTEVEKRCGRGLPRKDGNNLREFTD